MAWSGSSELLLGGGGGMSFDILVADDLLREISIWKTSRQRSKIKGIFTRSVPKNGEPDQMRFVFGQRDGKTQAKTFVIEGKDRLTVEHSFEAISWKAFGLPSQQIWSVFFDGSRSSRRFINIIFK